MKLMQPTPIHGLSSIFVGRIEPWYPGKQLACVVDEWGDVVILGDLSDIPSKRVSVEMLDDLLAMAVRLQVDNPEYQDGVYIQAALMPEHKANNQAEHLRVHHVMPAASLQRGRDTAPICVRQADLDKLHLDLPHDGPVWSIPSFSFMTRCGVIDHAKIADTAFDLMVDQVVLKNNYSFWDVNAQPHRIDGKGGPAWTLWKRDSKPVEEDF